MKKEIIISISVLVIIIIADVVTTKITDDKVKNIDSNLSNLQSKIESINKNDINEEVIKETQKVKNEWLKDEKIFSYYIEHQELEKVGTEMDSLDNYIKCKDKHDLKLNNFF